MGNEMWSWPSQVKWWPKQKAKVISYLLHKVKKIFSENAGLYFVSPSCKLTAMLLSSSRLWPRERWQGELARSRTERQREPDLISHQVIPTNCSNSKENMNSIVTKYDMELFRTVSYRGKYPTHL